MYSLLALPTVRREILLLSQVVFLMMFSKFVVLLNGEAPRTAKYGVEVLQASYSMC